MEVTEAQKQLQLSPITDTNSNFPEISIKNVPFKTGHFLFKFMEEQINQRTYKQVILK